MYRGHSIGVVVPAYNEAERIGTVLDTVPQFVDRVYAVDDASTDDTWAEIRRRVVDEDARPAATGTEAVTASRPDGGATAGPDVIPIRHERNRGVGGAIKTGYLHSLDDGLDVVAVMAGDGQMDPTYLPALLDPIVDDEADYTKGNRLVRPDHYEEMPRFRLIGNEILTLLTRIASGYWAIGDPQNGYTAIRREALEALDIDALYEFYGYCNELLVRLNVHEQRVVDVPIPATYGDETSDIEYGEYIPRVSAMLLRSYLWRIERSYVGSWPHPVAVLAAVGILGVSATVVQAAASAVSSLSSPDVRPLAGGVVALLLSFVIDAWHNSDINDVSRDVDE